MLDRARTPYTLLLLLNLRVPGPKAQLEQQSPSTGISTTRSLSPCSRLQLTSRKPKHALLLCSRQRRRAKGAFAWMGAWPTLWEQLQLQRGAEKAL
eukprot:1142083-Pelagomonas_calceolata.AAC.2